MKRLLLIVMLVVAFTGMSMAQNVYSGGTYQYNDQQHAAVYRNSELYAYSAGATMRFVKE